MARPREFDETAAVESAMNCFWQHGYDSTSMRDLAASVGMSAPSVYKASGDKQRLFARALELYRDCNARDLVNRLESLRLPKKSTPRSLPRLPTTRPMIENKDDVFSLIRHWRSLRIKRSSRCRDRQTIWRDRSIRQKMHSPCASRCIDAACRRCTTRRACEPE
jgi:AcrR family transcriptional regulator